MIDLGCLAGFGKRLHKKDIIPSPPLSCNYFYFSSNYFDFCMSISFSPTSRLYAWLPGNLVTLLPWRLVPWYLGHLFACPPGRLIA